MKYYLFLFIFLNLFFFTCGNGKAEKDISKILAGKEIKLDNYCKEIINAIIEEDLEKLTTYFDDVVKFGDYELGPEAKKVDGYRGFLNKTGLFYELFYDTEKLNKKYEGDVDRYYIFQKEAPCILDAIKNSKIILLDQVDNSYSIYIIFEGKNYYDVNIIMKPISKKIYIIYYDLN